MNDEKHKTDGAEEALDHGERPGRTPNRIDRRHVLKLALASAPVIITFTAGVARVDALGYSYVMEERTNPRKDGPRGEDNFILERKEETSPAGR